MRPEQFLEADLLEIIFDGRNKDYGAYQLRKEYNRHLLISSAALLLMLGLAFGWQILKTDPIMRPLAILAVADTLKPVTVILNPEPEQPRQAQPVIRKTINNSVPVIVAEDIDETVPEIKTLISSEATIGSLNIEGPLAEGPAGSGTEPGSAEGAAAIEPEKPDENRIFTKAERMPAFPGGAEALRRFLSKHLRVPEDQLDPGEKQKVIVRFVIDREGKVESPEFPEGTRSEFVREIRRVMAKMPLWEPGWQNGRSVKVYFTIPVIFQGSE